MMGRTQNPIFVLLCKKHTTPSPGNELSMADQVKKPALVHVDI
jgi:hypothetical protein